MNKLNKTENFNTSEGNVKEDNISLTEKLKKGELEAGWYYVLLLSNEEYITFIDGKWVVDDRLIEADIKEVLAPVPSYEEYLESEAHCAVYSEYNKSLKEENAKLKEFLKE